MYHHHQHSLQRKQFLGTTSTMVAVVAMMLSMLLSSAEGRLTSTQSLRERTSFSSSNNACNATLRSGFSSLETAITQFHSVTEKCNISSNSGNNETTPADSPNTRGGPFSKLTPACVAAVDTILYEMSNASIAFTKAVQRCAAAAGNSSSLTPQQQKCQSALSNITKYEFLGAVGFPQIVDTCDHNPDGYDCKSGVVALIFLAMKLVELQPEMIANCLLG